MLWAEMTWGFSKSWPQHWVASAETGSPMLYQKDPFREGNNGPWFPFRGFALNQNHTLEGKNGVAFPFALPKQILSEKKERAFRAFRCFRGSGKNAAAAISEAICFGLRAGGPRSRRRRRPGTGASAPGAASRRCLPTGAGGAGPMDGDPGRFFKARLGSKEATPRNRGEVDPRSRRPLPPPKKKRKKRRWEKDLGRGR